MRTLLVVLALALALAPCALAAQAPLAPARPLLSAAPDTLSAYHRQTSWFSRDKGLHFAISAAGAAGVYALGREWGLGRWAGVAVSAGLVGAVGVLREIAQPVPGDMLTRRFFSRRDLVWDAAGIAVGIAVTDRLLRRRWAREEPAP